MNLLSLSVSALILFVILLLGYWLGRLSRKQQEIRFHSRYGSFWVIFNWIHLNEEAPLILVSVLCNLAKTSAECARADEVIRHFKRFEDLRPALHTKWDVISYNEVEHAADLRLVESYLLAGAYRVGSDAHHLAERKVREMQLRPAM